MSDPVPATTVDSVTDGVAAMQATDSAQETVVVDGQSVQVPERKELRDVDRRDLETVVDVAARKKLLSSTSFTDLPIAEHIKETVLRNLSGDLGFNEPSNIQATLVPLIAAGGNKVGQAINGSGKTVAFLLGIATRVRPGVAGPQAVVVAHTRELAVGILLVCRALFKDTAVSVEAAIRQARRDIPTSTVVIGTPGTLSRLLKKGARSGAFAGVHMLVVDEADELLANGSNRASIFEISKLLTRAGGELQRVLISATFPKEVEALANVFAPDADGVLLENVQQQTLETVQQQILFTKDRLRVVAQLMDAISTGQTIIFAKTRRGVADLAETLTKNGHVVSAMHGGLPSEERDDVVDRFRKLETMVLITTDVLARGVDFEGLQLVINYDVPITRQGERDVADPATYLHRIGRTGRFGKLGVAITLVCDSDEFEKMDQISQYYQLENLPNNRFSQLDIIDKEDEFLDRIEEQVKEWMTQEVKRDVPAAAPTRAAEAQDGSGTTGPAHAEAGGAAAGTGAGAAEAEEDGAEDSVW